MKKYIEENQEILKQLDLFVPIVNKVHGKNHPEFNEVKRNYEVIDNKLKNNDFNLTVEFNNLKKITNNYKIPNGVCESYEAVYNMLEKLDNSFNKR
ncbi:MAG TPA: iron-sulfur cluster repair di-iron protein, ric [Acholeplasma sp.]|nr:iron-sulfur cluster repair di-iron protein, ric [Acholeplasma sp.]